MVTVQLLGGASLRAGDTPLTGPPAQRHRIALLTLTVAAWPQPVARDRAMALLWPEKDTASARRLLNLAVHVLRTALGESTLASAGDGLVFNPARVHCDLHELRTAIAVNDAERIVRAHSGVLLDAFHLDDAPEFGYWLDERRTELAHAYTGALRALAERYERAGDAHAWVGACRRLVAADPYSGPHARLLMRALDAAGDRGAAIRHAHEHARRLREELDLEPDAGVVTLARELRERRTLPVRVSIAPDASPPIRSASVAVLPFRALGATGDDTCFADGVTEDVVAHLSRIGALRVIARTSVKKARERHGTPREIGAALGVATVLDGSVRRAGDRVRIVAQLVDASSDRQLWAETYDREISDIFAIQTDVALRIADALRAELTPDEHARVQRAPTADLQAYRIFLQGREHFIRYTIPEISRALEQFDAAVAADPAFALAHAYVAMANTELMEVGGIAPDVARRRALDGASRALALAPELGEAHCAMAYTMALHELDWGGAEREYRRAIELSPGNSEAYDLYGRLCAAVGRFDEAIALLEQARTLDPLAHRLDLATVLIRAGRYAEAVRLAEDAAAFDPGHDRAHATLGWAYFHDGRRADGIAELERAVAIAPENTMWLAQLGQARGMTGDAAGAREILRDLERRAAAGGYVSPYHMAYVHTGLGESECALDWLERAVARRAGPAYGIKGSFLFTPLREHPRFRALLREMRLE